MIVLGITLQDRRDLPTTRHGAPLLPELQGNVTECKTRAQN